MTEHFDSDRTGPASASPEAGALGKSRSAGRSPHRRRFLASGLVAGSASLLAARPIQTLAAATTTDGRFCSISGMHSGVASGHVTATCNGLSPGYYKMRDHWPSPSSLLKTSKGTFTPDTPFNKVFNSSLRDTLINVLNNDTKDPEFHWVAALLNACQPASFNLNYPYTPDQVVAFYPGTEALNFFKTLENI
jgi:hypothetical protein